MKVILSEFKKAAIVGWYRQGASFKEIGELIGMTAENAEFVVTTYFANKNLESTKKLNWFQKMWNKYRN